MTGKQWDGDDFRRRMRQKAVNANRYADEHQGRLNRKQGNGSASVRDEYRGQSTICDVLSTSAASADRDRLRAYLDELESVDLYPGIGVNKDDFRRGVQFVINEVRASLD